MANSSANAADMDLQILERELQQISTALENGTIIVFLHAVLCFILLVLMFHLRAIFMIRNLCLLSYLQLYYFSFNDLFFRIYVRCARRQVAASARQRSLASAHCFFTARRHTFVLVLCIISLLCICIVVLFLLFVSDARRLESVLGCHCRFIQRVVGRSDRCCHFCLDICFWCCLYLWHFGEHCCRYRRRHCESGGGQSGFPRAAHRLDAALPRRHSATDGHRTRHWHWQWQWRWHWH
jgi:hypothetical protein